MSENKESKMTKTTCACYSAPWVERPVECTCLCTCRKPSNFYRMCMHSDEEKCRSNMSVPCMATRVPTPPCPSITHLCNCRDHFGNMACLYVGDSHWCICPSHRHSDGCQRVDMRSAWHASLPARRKVVIVSALEDLKPVGSEIADPVNIAGLIESYLSPPALVAAPAALVAAPPALVAAPPALVAAPAALVAAPAALVVNPTCLCKPCLYGLSSEFYCLKNKKGCVCKNDVYLLIGVECDNKTHFCVCDQGPARPRICEHDDDVKCGTDISKGNCENIPIKRVCLFEEKEYRPHNCICRRNFDNPACLRVDNTPFHLTLSSTRRKTEILSALDLLKPAGSEIADPVNIAGLIAGFL